MNHNLIEKILSGEATEAEKKQFNQWLGESESNKDLFEKNKILWNRLDGVYAHSTFDLSNAKKSIRSRIQDKKQAAKQRRMRVWISAAASVLLLIGLGLSAIYVNNQNLRNKIVYASGEQVKEIVLSDGSHVWLNTNSSLEVFGNFGRKRREVLLKGEAFFEVNRDESKPFQIHAGETITEVLGTSFNVNSDTVSGDVNVIVNTGKVGFYHADQKDRRKILMPNDQATYLAKELKILLSVNSNPNFLSWKTGILKFYDTPIGEVCSALSKHYHKQVVCNPGLSGMTLTGTFENESLDSILKVMKLTLDVNIAGTNKEIVIQK